MTKIIVIGGAGFIGSHLVNNLLEGEYEVTILDNLSSGVQNLDSIKGVEFIKGDIRDKELVSSSINDHEIVVHLAAMNRADRSIINPFEAHDINVTGTMNILEEVRKNDLKLIFASSSSVFGSLDIQPRPENATTFRPLHPYATGKLAGEFSCINYKELYGLDISIIRYFTVYGPRQIPYSEYSAVIPRFINSFLNREANLHVYGETSRNFSYINDTVDATRKLIDCKKPKSLVYNIGGLENISIINFIHELEKIFGYKINITREEFRHTDQSQSIPIMNNLKKEFNFTPNWSFIKGLSATINWYRVNTNYFNN